MPGMQSNFLPENHVFLTTQSDMQSITKSLFTHPQVKMFDFCRLYYNGHISVLSTNIDITHYVFNKDIPLASAPTEYLNKQKACYMIKEEGVYSRILHEMKEQFELENFINFIERTETYTDVFCFAGANNANACDFYLNNIDYLQNFIATFKDKASDLISLVDSHKESLTDQMLCNLVTPPTSLKNAQRLLTIDNKPVMLTSREIDVLHFVARGYSAHHISDKLQISRRTVEHHIVNIKNKIGVRSKSSLIELLSSTNWAHF